MSPVKTRGLRLLYNITNIKGLYNQKYGLKKRPIKASDVLSTINKTRAIYNSNILSCKRNVLS